MDRKTAMEVEALLSACLDSIERDATPPMAHYFVADMGSSDHEHSVLVAEELQRQLHHVGIHAKVAVKKGVSSLTVSVFYPGTYVTDSRDGRWFVDQPAGDCWYFETADQVSADRLAATFNAPPHAANLQALSPDIGIDEDSLRFWLYTLRDNGIDVVTFAHKGTGIFNRNNLLPQ
jgi:hypothetical protein